MTKDHFPCQPLPENPAIGVSRPSGSTSTSLLDPRARLRAYIDSHPVVIVSKSACKRCAEALKETELRSLYILEALHRDSVKKLFESMSVPYFLLELDQAELR
ncbi:Thioredoxin reductase 1, cytoplasmic [Vulpes lagopus]